MSEPSNTTVLVTGSNGLLGKAVLQKLSPTHTVHGLVHNTPDDPVEKVNYVTVDFSSGWQASRLPENVDTVIHLAQSNHYKEFPEKAPDIFRVNVDSTARLLHHAFETGVRHFIYASSGGVYQARSEPVDESAPLRPVGDLGYYLASKLCGEALVRNYASHFHTTVLRFFFIYGPGQKQTMLIPRLIDSVRTGNPITLQGEEGIRINPIHVTDAAEAVTQAMALKGDHLINVAGEKPHSLKEIATTIGERLDRSPRFRNADEEAGDIIADISAMKSKLGAPAIDLNEGLAETI